MKLPVSVWIIIALSLEPSCLLSQSSQGKIPLTDFILQMEDKYGITFNYDPEMIKEILVTPIALPETPALMVNHLKKKFLFDLWSRTST